MHSPLKMRLGLHASKTAITAIIELLMRLLFYKQERKILEAEAALRWEDVYARRLDNVKSAIEIVTLADQHAPEQIEHPPTDYHVARLLEAALKLEHSGLKLTRLDAKEE